MNIKISILQCRSFYFKTVDDQQNLSSTVIPNLVFENSTPHAACALLDCTNAWYVNEDEKNCLN